MAVLIGSRAQRLGRLAVHQALTLARRVEASPHIVDHAPGRLVSARSPITPAAVRVERSRADSANGKARQTAVTMWFGQGPALPAPGQGDAFRGAVRVAAGVVGVTAMAAMAVLAAQASAERARLHAAPTIAGRIAPPDSEA